MTFSTLASPGVSLQGGGGSGGGGGTPGGSDTQIQYNNSGAFAGASGLTTNGTELTIASGTKTADAPVLNMSQTWNNGAVTFTGLKFNAAGTSDANSAAASLLMDLQVNTASRFSVSKAGGIKCAPNGNAYLFLDSEDLQHFNSAGVRDMLVGGNALGVALPSIYQVTWGSTSTTPLTRDLFLTRRAAANLRLGAADTTGTTAPTPQFLSAQSWLSSTTNNQTGANFTIDGSQGTGTGAGGSIIFRVAPAGGTSNGVQNGLITFLEATSARAFNLYGAFTDTSNYERLTLNFTASNDYVINVNKAGTGSNRSLTIETYGNSTATFESETLKLPNNGRFAFSSTSSSRGSVDLSLTRDAANTLAQRNGANAQLFRVYRTTDGTNASWLEMDANANGNAYIGTNKTGTGVAGPLYLLTGGTARWQVNSSGHFTADTDNTYDIGTNTATRPRSVYVASSITPGRGVTVATLPTPATGMIARVTDATAPVIGATVTGGGAAYALVNYNGANWTVIGV